jgi:conjugative transfer signal peptidase TraF
MKTLRLRIRRLCVFIGVIVLIVYATDALDLRFNFTPSMPLGIYRLTPVPKSGVQRGMFVVVCAPLAAAELGRRRGYLGSGRCTAETEPLLKAVAAVAGDVVAVSANGVAVNGRPLPHSSSLSIDAAGRPLSPLPHEHFELRRGELWLYAANDRSWDSRYWGPAQTTEVRAGALPLLVLPAVLGLRAASMPAKSRMQSAAARLDGASTAGVRTAGDMLPYSPHVPGLMFRSSGFGPSHLSMTRLPFPRLHSLQSVWRFLRLASPPSEAGLL